MFNSLKMQNIKKAILIVLLLISTIFSAYKWGIVSYNARTSGYNVEYFAEKCADTTNVRIRDIKILEHWKCFNAIYNISKNEWLMILVLNISSFALVLPPKNKTSSAKHRAS